jgi:hypothetical protein
MKMDEEQKQKKADLINLADQAVKKVAVEFTENLKSRVHDIEMALHRNELQKVVELSYNLESEAATFGWPRITRVCKWLRKFFSGDYDKKPQAEDVLKTLNALKLMVSDPNNPDEERDEDLFRELYPVLSEAVSDI